MVGRGVEKSHWQKPVETAMRTHVRNTPVHNKDKAVVCDLCEHWMHAQFQDIPDATYAFLSENEDSSIKWYCNHCKVIATGVVTEVGKIAKS